MPAMMDILLNANAIIPLIIIIKLSSSEPDSYQALVHSYRMSCNTQMNLAWAKLYAVSNFNDIEYNTGIFVNNVLPISVFRK